jgi:L-rhamnose mutarotase
MNDNTETIAFRLTLVPGQIATYRKRHDEIWPELEEALRAAGVIEYRIFNQPGDTALFAVMRRRKNHDLDALAKSAVMRRWWDMMRDVTVTGLDGAPVQQALETVYVMRQTV